MPRSRPLLFLGLAVGIAFITSLMMYQWLNQAKAAKSDTAVAIKTNRVAVVTVDLPWGTKLSDEMIELVSYPSGYLPEGSFESRVPLLDRVLTTNLKRNEPIIESKLAPQSVTTGGVAAVMHRDHRAMAIRVDDVVGVAGFVKPGDRVDVMVTLHQSHESKHAVTKIVLQNTLVLASGTEMERKGKDLEATPVKVITLEVTPQEAELLGHAGSEGSLRLVLRNPLNSLSVTTRGATVDSLLTAYRPVEKKAASKPPPEAETKVQVIKGGTVSNLTFQ